MRVIPRLVPFALVCALAGCTEPGARTAAPSSAPPSARVGFGGRQLPVVTQVQQATFRTPSKNIFCDLTSSSVRCDIVRKTWQPPAKPADCELDWGNGLFLESGEAGVTCTGDTLIGAAKRTLEYGTALRAGDIQCESESSGLTCTSDKTGHGFTLAAARYTLF
jgi:hypothetical protein